MHTTGDISGFPFVATLVKYESIFLVFEIFFFVFSSCTLWVLYGYTANISTIIIVNFIGATLQMLYALTYLRYTPDRVNLKGKKTKRKFSFLFLFRIHTFV